MFSSPSALMRLAVLFVLPLAVTVLHPAPASSQETDGAVTSLAITPVTVIDVEEGVARPDQTVVIEGDRITAVGSGDAVEIPAGARVVDGTGEYLMPGLWDMHTHSWNEAVLRENVLPLYVAHGVTGIRIMNGEPYDRKQRAEIARGHLQGPRMLVGSPDVDGPNPWEEGNVAVRVDGPRRAHDVADSLKAHGYDFIQTSQFLSSGAYRALHERASEVGMEVSGRVPFSVSLWEAAALGHRTVEHLWGMELACSSREEELRVQYRQRVAEIAADTSLKPHLSLWNRAELEPLATWDPVKCRALYRHLAAHETWVVPTLLPQHFIAYPSDPAVRNDPRWRYLPDDVPGPEVFAEWFDPEIVRPVYEHRLRTLVDMHREGVGILAGGELPVGFTLHDELALYVESGLSPLEALRTATLNPARYLDATDSLGTVEEGKLADLVLLDANPLEDIKNTREIVGVVFDGRYLDREALDGLLAEAERAAQSAGSPSADSSSTNDSPVGQASEGDTVHVAPPTGETETDRANVQAAFDAVKPGGTIQFAPGTYLLGAGARLTVPDVTVVGHPNGTVLRGCDPEAFEVGRANIGRVVFGCTGLYVQAQRQTIRDLTFEYTWHGIVVGPYPTTAEEASAFWESGEGPPDSYPAGGQRIEGNTFRATPNGLRVLGTGEERSIVRDNDFVDVFHAIGIYGAPLHFLGNRVTVEDPGRVPSSRHPGSAILVSPGHTDCAGHVIAGNRVEGYPGAIYVLANRGQSCRGVEIRDNMIEVRRVKVPAAWVGATPSEDDSTMVGVPITLTSLDRPVPWRPEVETEGVVEEIVIEGNRLLGAEGLGILVDGSRNRISRNVVTGIRRREPFPGVTWIGDEHVTWETANGSGIWLSPGSEQNEIVGNTFGDVAAAAVVVEGDSNRVVLARPEDEVRDLGNENRVSIAESTSGPAEMGLSGGNDFDSSPQQAPLVCIDEGHQEMHTAGGTYALFAEWLRAEGFRVNAFTAPFEEATLKRCRVLVVANALHARNQGNWALPTPSAFTPEEIEEVRSWVRDGGGLLLIADHMPFPGAARDLGDAFGLRFSNGFAVDTAVSERAYGPYRGTSRFVFRDRDGSLASHPVTEGLDGGAPLDSVVTYTGQVFRAHGRYQPLLVAPAGTISLLPQEAWRFDEQTPVLEAGGWLQGAAAEFGAGRVVALGEAAQFRPDDRGEARGANAAFATNVVRWLAGLDAP